MIMFIFIVFLFLFLFYFLSYNFSINGNSAVVEIKELFKEHPDLVEGLTAYIQANNNYPDSHAASSSLQ